jgi:hypothetical protein
MKTEESGWTVRRETWVNHGTVLVFENPSQIDVTILSLRQTWFDQSWPDFNLSCSEIIMTRGHELPSWNDIDIIVMNFACYLLLYDLKNVNCREIGNFHYLPFGPSMRLDHLASLSGGLWVVFTDFYSLRSNSKLIVNLYFPEMICLLKMSIYFWSWMGDIVGWFWAIGRGRRGERAMPPESSITLMKSKSQTRSSKGVFQGVKGKGVLSKVLLESPLLYHYMPCGWPFLKWPYSRFRGYRYHGKRSKVVLLPPWIPHAIRRSYLCTFSFQR